LKIEDIVVIQDRETENDKQKDEPSLVNSLSNNNNSILSLQRPKIDTKSLSGFTELEKSEMYYFQYRWDQNHSSFLTNFGDVPPVPDQKNAILRPEPVATQFLYGDYNNFLFGNDLKGY
jgi:hypothetical protein